MKPSTAYRRLLPFLKPHLPRFLLGCVCMILTEVFNGLSLGMVVPLVDRVFTRAVVPVRPDWLPMLQTLAAWLNRQDPNTLLGGIALAAFLALLGKALGEFFQNWFMNGVALGVLRDIRNTLYRHLMGLSLDYFTEQRAGTLVSRVTYDVSVIQNSLTGGLADFVRQLTKVAIMTTVLFALDWKLALITFLLFPALAFPIVRLGRILRKIGVEVQERMAEINATLVESFAGIGVIKAFLLERRKQETFQTENQAYYKANVRTVKRMAALGGVTEVIGAAGGLGMLVVGGRQVLSGQLSAGLFTLFLAALVSLVQPFKRLSQLHAVNQQAAGAAQRVLEVLDTPPTVREAPDAAPLPRLARGITFDHVEFQYPSTTALVLRDIALEVAPGELVAIVGPSGAGKTTLVNLLPRFYDPTSGRVLVDGVDLRRVTLASLRAQIGIVTQETFLFHDSVRANIAFGAQEADEHAIIAAATAANAHEFITRLPRGYDTMIGERGLKLSGGERQRIAIARAILRNPPVLILDEATSQLDTASEHLVQEALERLMAGRTAFVIAHRLSTVRRASRIVVLEGGRIVEQGRHDELIQRGGLYQRLCELQFADIPAAR